MGFNQHMERATIEKRRRSRAKSKDSDQIKVSFESRPGVVEVIHARLNDLGEWGCGIRLDKLLKIDALVTVAGPFFGDSEEAEARVRARVSWLRVVGPGEFLAGLSFEDRLRPPRPEPNPRATTLNGAEHDYYELLQVSPSADSETIQRVYRMLAQRFHPDNQETGDDGMFRLISEAHAVLSDPGRRAAYDVAHQAMRSQRWKIFDRPEAAIGVEAEKHKRQGILSLLYIQRIQVFSQPWLTLRDFEELLGCPREHLEFSLWYLKEQGWVERSDNGRHTITVAGVNEAERSNYTWMEPKKLLTSGIADPANA
jgi:hypothetical protein